MASSGSVELMLARINSIPLQDAHKSKKQSSLVSSSRADQEDDDDVEAMLKDIDYFERVTIDSSSTDNMVVRANKGEVLVECDGGHCMMYQPVSLP